MIIPKHCFIKDNDGNKKITTSQQTQRAEKQMEVLSA